MFVARTCPITGVVNLYRPAEPHLPVATIHPRGAPKKFYWWNHLAEGAGTGSGAGVAIDLSAATEFITTEVTIAKRATLTKH